eukprot:g8261.t1
MIPLNNVSLAFHGPGGRGGYKLPHMSQIWAAAADRKEMVLMWWWKPDVLFFEYAGTEFEMFVVLFPESTKECRVVRQEAYKNLCKNELPQTLRNYSGAYCDDEPQVLQKVLSVSLQVQAKKINDQLFNDLYVPSPAYSFLKDYQFDGENLQKVFKRYYDIKRTHKYSQDRWKQIEKVAMSHSLCSVIYVETIFQDSDSIGMAVYNGSISQLIPLILYMNIANINQDGTINLLVSAACRWWTASALWAFYFNPRFTNIVTKTLRACANTNYYKSIKRIVSAKSDAWTIDAKEVEIQKTIGKGAYGTVLLGTYGNTKVAVKKFAKAALSNADFVAELVSLVDLRHKHLVQFVGAILNTHSLVIDYMERGTLNRILQDYSINLSAESLHAFASNIALGLEYLHSKGMTHCDMKSENILVDEHWVCKISDFGLSEFVKDDMAPTHSESLRAITSDRDDGESEENVPASSGPKGTLLYQPPEVTLGGEYTQSGDIFAFSLILYEIVTRKELFFDATSNAYQRVLQVANHNLRPTWVFDGPGLNEAEAEGIQKVAETCWDNNPEKRHSAAEACTKLLRGEDDTDGIETSGVKLANWTKNPNAKVDRSLDPGAQTARLPSGFDPSQHKWMPLSLLN